VENLQQSILNNNVIMESLKKKVIKMDNIKFNPKQTVIEPNSRRHLETAQGSPRVQRPEDIRRSVDAGHSRHLKPVLQERRNIHHLDPLMIQSSNRPGGLIKTESVREIPSPSMVDRMEPRLKKSPSVKQNVEESPTWDMRLKE